VTTYSREQVLEAVDRAWAALEGAVEDLDDDQLLVTGADGWSVKDHLAHVAAWQLSLAALLGRRDRHRALGVAGTGPTDFDAKNAILHRRLAGLVPDEVRALLRGAHELVLQALYGLGDDDLDLPYADFQPADPRPDRDQPVVGWVGGMAIGHVEEHLGYIQALLGRPG
jgi:hypothetical protein